MTKQQRTILVVSILASFVSFLDGTVINVALPAIEAELGGGLVTQQWVTNAYLITLGAFMLLAGSLSDVFGRKKILFAGLIGFAVASILCAIAPNALFLIIARGLQGIAGALLVPSSLALIISGFSGAAQGKAIGTWTAWTSIAAVIGPVLGGAIVDASSWRVILAINVVPIAVTLWYMRKLAAHNEDIDTRTKVDAKGAALGALGLGGVVYALIEQARFGWEHPVVLAPLLIGSLLLVAFVMYEKRAEKPMLPLSLFNIRNFSVGNVATVAIYGALSLATFLIAIYVQQTGGYSALQAGMVLLPITIVMFSLSPLVGKLSGTYGPRWFMCAGPVLSGLGFLTMLSVSGQPINYWTQLFPGVILFSLGLTLTVSPLTSAVLGSINSKQAGIGSAVNNAVSRIAGLVAIAAIGIVIGPTLDTAAFHRGLIVMATLMIIGGIVSAIGIRNSQVQGDAPLQKA